MTKHGSEWRLFRKRAYTEFFLFLSLVSMLILSGCGHPWSRLEEGSYERGLSEAEGGAPQQAIEDLKVFIRRNPQDPRADDAQFLVGKSYMELEDYPVAAVEFEILQVDYPGSELADDGAYLEALCYVKQVPDYRLDQTVTYKAVKKLQAYLKKHHDGKFVKEARDELSELQDQLERKSFEEASFYKRRGNLDAAHQVFQNILANNPSTPLRAAILLMQGEIDLKLENYDEAQTHLQEIVKRWPEVREAKKAEKLLKKVETARKEMQP